MARARPVLLRDVCRGLGRYAEAIDYLQQALQLRRRVDDPGGESQILNSLGDTYRDLDELDKAEEHYRQALGMWRETGDRWSEARTLTSIGDVAKALGNIDTAVECWRQALAICEELGALQTAEIQARLEHAASAGSDADVVNHRTGRHTEAITSYRQALTLRRNHGNAHQAANTLDRLGHLHLADGQTEQARTVWGEALRLYQEQARHNDADRIRRQLDDLDANTSG